MLGKLSKWNEKVGQLAQDVLLVRKLRRTHGMIKNVRHANHNKKILIIYIIDPFLRRIDKPFHVNVEQIVIIAKVFDELGYNIDVVDFNNEYEFELAGYDIVFGFGKNFDRAVLNSGAYTIAYLTGASPYWSNLAELHRLIEFTKRTGEIIELQRQVNCWNLYAGIRTDAAICTGNQWTKSTWEELYSRLYTINNQGLGRRIHDKVQRNLAEAKKNFCFFSGSGNLHKGLDLILECFKELREYELYIVTPIDNDFYEVYSEVFEQTNIHVLGKINVESKEFLDICNRCLFSILLSCSEGQASSVPTTMFGGMIPIVTKECGLDIEDGENGFLVQSVEIVQLVQRIREIVDIPELKLEEVSENAKTEAMIYHSIEYFELEFRKVIKDILMYKEGT